MTEQLEESNEKLENEREVFECCEYEERRRWKIQKLV